MYQNRSADLADGLFLELCFHVGGDTNFFDYANNFVILLGIFHVSCGVSSFDSLWFLRVVNCINPIWNRGGQICPGRHKPVCHFRAKCARVTKIHDFVPFHVRLVLEKLFFKFSIFFWKYRRSPKISKGGTLLCKN